MKLSKVQSVLDTFNIKNFGEYKIDSLDINRVPNPIYPSNNNQRKCQVTLLKGDGERQDLSPGELTRFEADTEELRAIEVVIQHPNKDGIETEKMLLIN